MGLLILVFALLLGPAAGQTGDQAAIAALREVGDRFDRAQLTGDRAALDEMVSDGLVFIASDGTRQGKQAFIAGWTDPDVRFAPVTITAPYVMVLGPDAGIVGGEAVLRGTSGTISFASHIRFADTFQRIDGRWRAVHIQVTRVAPARN